MRVETLDKKNILVLLLLVSSGCSLILASQLEVTYAAEYRMIDLFTQKKPYDGKGLNQSSDAFAPQEEVILYAYLTYRDAPVANKLVAFAVFGPVNPLNNITFSRTAITNASGIATIDFRIPWPTEDPETVIFGTWKAHASADIAEVQAEDTLTFKVGWIVEILSITTINENLQPQTIFGKGTCVGVKLVLRNIAMTPKMAFLAVIASDAMKVPFGDILIDNFEVQPGGTYIYIYCTLQIPEWVAVGVAMVNTSAYTAPLELGGIPYCPEVSTAFLITVRNVAVISVVPSATSIVAGQTVTISVVVRNEGSSAETFEVSAYYDSIRIGTSSVVSLPPNAQRNLIFIWNTSSLSDDTYTISAVASALPGEINVNDNTYINGAVTIRSMPIYAIPRGLTIMALIVAAAIAMIAIVLLMSRRRKKKPSQNPSVLLHVDVLP